MAVERWTFVASGHEQVVAAYKSIAQQASRTEQRTARSAQKQGSAWSAAGRPLRATEKLAMKVAAAQQRAAKRAATAQIKEGKRVVDAAKKQAADRFRLSQKIERQQTQAAKRTADKQIKMVERVAKAQQRAADKVASSRRRTMGAIGGAALRGIGVAGAAGIGIMGGAARQSMQLRDKSIQLAVKGGRPQDADMMRRKFENIAISTPGAKAAGIAGAAERFVAKTGRVDKAMDFANVFAEISVATGAAAEDIGDAAADLFEKFDINTVEEMAGAMADLAVQGKRGAFELSDAAAQFPKLAAAAQGFGIGKGRGAVKTLGGLTQISRRATGSPQQAATALEAMFRQFTAKSDVLKKKHGVSVFTETGAARDIRKLLVETISKVGGGDIEKKKVGLQKIFGEEGIRALRPMISEFADATIAGKDGVKVLTDYINKAIDATGAEAEIKNDLAAMQEQAGVQLTHAWETVAAEIGSAAVPALATLAKSMTTFVRDTDFTGVSQALVAFVEALELGVEVMKFFNLVEMKKKDPIADAAAKRKDVATRISEAGLSNEQMKQIAAISKMEQVASLGGGMVDLPSRLGGIGVTPEQYQMGKKFLAEDTAALAITHSGGPTRQETLERLAQGLSTVGPKGLLGSLSAIADPMGEAEKLVSQTEADPSTAYRPSGIDVPLLGRVGTRSKEVDAALEAYAQTLKTAQEKQKDAEINISKLGETAESVAKQLEEIVPAGGGLFAGMFG